MRILAAVAVCSVLALTSCGSASDGGASTASPPSTSAAEEATTEEAPADVDESSAYSEDDPEALLATIDEAADDDSTLDRYAKVLDRLERVCTGSSRSQLADILTNAQKILRDDGTSVSTLHIGSAVGRSVPSGARGTQKCTDLVAVYISLVESGQAP